MTITWWLIVSTAAIWIAWDIFADWKWGNKATESVLIDKWARLKPFIFLAGFLCGHLFWQVHICN
jgi:hypothetical protein